MKYVFNEEYDLPITERILSINNITKKQLNINDYSFNNKINIIEKFKESILANKDKRFLIVGDYDCDGICATTIMVKLFNDLNIKCNYYIPSRSKDGYGLNNKIVDNAHDNGFDCLLCVDNGIIAYEQIKYAKSFGIQTYIIDHHEYQNEPDCVCYVHPNILDREYYDMCAGGLCSLISNSFRYDELTTVLGGLATLADMVNVLGFNRFLLNEMITILRTKKIKPINLLLGNNEVTYTNIQYNVIPKINSVSRMEEFLNVNYVVKYLLSENDCNDCYSKIETINKTRKENSNMMFDLARNNIEHNKNILTVYNENFKEGLCGIIANKLVSEYNKPTIVFAKNNNELKGSGRSIPGFNLYNYINGTRDILNTFGGHEQAIGLSLDIDNYKKLQQYIDNNPIEYEEIYKDVLLLNEDNLKSNLLDCVEELNPYGTGFNEVLFGINASYIKKNYIVSNKYPKFEINDHLSAISFNSKHIDKNFNYMIGHLKEDNYNPNSISFIIEDLL